MTDMQATDGNVVEVAHEAQIRPWLRQRTWPQTDQAELVLRESV
jgi:hypothetical protein